MIKSYIKIALRNFLKRKLHSIINVIGLSVAIACCLLVYLFVNNEMNYDKFHVKHENIYRLNVKTKRGADQGYRELGAAASVMAPELASNLPEIEAFVRTKGGVALVKVNDQYKEEEFTYADPELFDVFTFPLISGEYQSLRWDANSVILSQEYAEKWFNTTDAVGKSVAIKLNDKFVPLTVKGVLKKLPSNSSIRFNFLMPYSLFESNATGDWLTSWHAWGVPTYLLLKPGISKVDFESKMTQIMQSNFDEESRDNYALSVQPMADLYLNEDVRSISRRGSASTSWIMMAIATFILIIACINFTNLSIGMALPRIKEIGIRKVVGASRFLLLIQLLGETLLYTIVAFVFAILITDLMLPSFGELTNTSMDLWQQFDINIVLFGSGLIVLITMLAGSYPALAISRFNAVRSLKNQEKVGTGNLLVKSLVVVQFSLAVFFVLGVVIMSKQVDYFHSADKGYDDKSIITSWIKDMKGEVVMKELNNRFGSFSSVKGITAQGRYGYWYTKGDDEFSVVHYRVDDNYLSTLDIELLAGRNFDSNRVSDPTNSIIVNKAFLDEIGMKVEEAVGEHVPFNAFDDMMEPQIIGVIDNVNFESLTRAVGPNVLHVNSGIPFKTLMVKLEDGNLAKGIAEIEELWKEMVSYYPFEYEFLETQNQEKYAEQENEKIVVTYSGLIAILISCLGLFALSSLHIQQRTKEVGVRKTLGAGVYNLLFTLSKEFTIIVVIALSIATPLAWYFGEQWLSNFAYRISINPLWFVYSSVMVIVMAYASIAYQTIRTANINPVDALRDE